MDELAKKEEMEDKKSARRAPPSAGASQDMRTTMQLWKFPERENSWTCSDFLFQTYPFLGLQRWEGKKAVVLPKNIGASLSSPLCLSLSQMAYLDEPGKPNFGL